MIARLRASTYVAFHMPVEALVGVTGASLGRAQADMAVKDLFERMVRKELSAAQFLAQFAHFTSRGLDLLEQELLLVRKGVHSSAIRSFMGDARKAYRAGVLRFMDSGLAAWDGVLKADHVAFARQMLPAMLGVNLFPGDPHPFSREETEDMVGLFANLEALAVSNLKASSA